MLLPDEVAKSLASILAIKRLSCQARGLQAPGIMRRTAVRFTVATFRSWRGSPAYCRAVPGGADWGAGTEVKLDPDPKLTFMQDQLYVKNRRFNRKVDMSRDPTMYPFASDKYIVEFYYNPRSAPPHIQDKFGYNGEGMTDKLFMNTEVRKGQRVLYARFEFTRDELLRRGKWAEAENVPVRQTPTFVAGGAGPDVEDVIVVPNLRAPAKKP